jgi:MAF protein
VALVAGVNRRPLILASTSPYRRELMSRLQLPFTTEVPDFAEAPPHSMAPETLVAHNTLGKARAVAARHAGATVIAADQVAVCDAQVLGKPGSVAQASRQLRMLSGRTATFLTGLAVIEAGHEAYETVPYTVVMRELDDAEIRTYVALDQPLGCAGAFKAEGLGISLFARMEGEDPTALIGLPLIRLSAYLKPLADR